MLVIRGAYIRGGLYSGGAYIRDFTVFYLCGGGHEIQLCRAPEPWELF